MNFLKYKEEIEKLNNFKDEWFILGIDLGTTNSVVSYWDNKTKQVVPVDISMGFGKIPVPSVVQVRENDGNDEWIIGEEAYRSMNIYPESTIRSIKKKMGTSEKIQLGDKFYLPEEISAKLLKYIIESVEKLNPKAEIIGIVITVPYDFDDISKKATIKALEIAGYRDKLICLMEEPKATALYYSTENEINLDEKILIVDFGGGTLDTTLFHVSEKNEEQIKIKVINESGKASHGGDTIDEILLEKFYDFIKQETNLSKEDLTLFNIAELNEKAIEAKERLSGTKSYRVPFTFCVPPFIKTISRDDFEEYISDFIDKTRQVILNTLIGTKLGTLSVDEIDKIILGGGSSKMPWVKNMLIDIFNDESKIFISDSPATDISKGATIYSAVQMGVFKTTDILTENLKIEFDLSIPHDIGFLVENNGTQSFYPMIKRGTSYKSAKKSQIFTLTGEKEEDMEEFTLVILERINKNDDVSKCVNIGTVHFSNIPRRPSGKTKLEITISAIDESGLIKGTIEDMGYKDEYEKSGYFKKFSPNNLDKTLL